jgi:hypothetical protein
MFLKRSVPEILKDAAKSIAQNSPITNFSAGGVARSITEAMAPEIGTNNDPNRPSLYDFAQQVLDQGQLSKATDTQLDLIGGLFSYPRRTEQIRGADGVLFESKISNDMYRYEISQIAPTMATANYASLRFALLTIQGVKDIIPKEYSHGTGSFSFILIPQYGFNEQEIVTQMEAAIDKVKSFGIRPNVMLSEKVPVDLTVQLVFHESTSDPQKVNIRLETQNKIKDYIGKTERGKGIIYKDLIQEVMNTNNKIIDFELLKFYMSNEPVLLTNQDISEDEQLIPQNIVAL